MSVNDPSDKLTNLARQDLVLANEITVFTIWFQQQPQAAVPPDFRKAIDMLNATQHGKRSKGILVAVAAVVLLSARVEPTSAQKVLRWKFEEGQTLEWKTAQNADITMTINDMEQATNTSFTMTMGMFVKQVDEEGVASLEITMDRLQMEMQMAGQKMEFDTDSDEVPAAGIGEMLKKAFDPLMSMTYTIKMDPRGEILDVDVPEESLKMLKSIPGMGQFGKMFTKESMQDMSSTGWMTLPEKGLAVGDSWDTESETNNPILGKQTAATHFTYEGSEEVDGKSLEKISMEMDMKFDGDVENELGIKMNIEDMTLTGTFYFDAEQGRLASSEIKQQMEADLEAGGQSMHQVMDGTVTTTITEQKVETQESEKGEK